jgi:hypothetical protein
MYSSHAEKIPWALENFRFMQEYPFQSEEHLLLGALLAGMYRELLCFTFIWEVQVA